MAATLDETEHYRPDMIRWWVEDEQKPYMHEDFIHRYLSEAPFFDWTSKNGLILDQSKHDITVWRKTLNRQEFENDLRRRPGLEFMIVNTPQPVADKELAAQGHTTGIYTIRKQDRQRAPDMPYVRPPHVIVEKGPDGKDMWELTVLGTYFVSGEAMYQAPSVFDVVANRLLNTTLSLNKFFDVAASLPRFSPATGWHYLPQPAKAPASGSVPGTPSRSREGSVAPGTEDQSMRSGSVQPESQVGGTSTATNFKDSKLLGASLIDAIQFGDEYIDENPLLGEPGNFRFNASTAAVKKRRADEEAAAAKAKAEKESASTSRVTSPKAEKAPTPPAVFTEAKVAAKAEKSGKEDRRASKKGDKAARRKSKAVASGTATSPTTPGSATSTQAPNSAL